MAGDFNFTLSGCMTARAMMKRVADARPWSGEYGQGDPVVDAAFDAANEALDNPASIGMELSRLWSWKFWEDGPTYCEGDPQMTAAQALLDGLYNAGEAQAAATGGPRPGEVTPGSAADAAKKAKDLLDSDWGFWLKALVVIAVIVALAYAWRTFVPRGA
jgi:hypothetical protein